MDRLKYTLLKYVDLEDSHTIFAVCVYVDMYYILGYSLPLLDWVWMHTTILIHLFIFSVGIVLCACSMSSLDIVFLF